MVGTFLSVSSVCSATHWFCFTMKTPALLEGQVQKLPEDKFLKASPLFGEGPNMI